jgi:hypothetical protein
MGGWFTVPSSRLLPRMRICSEVERGVPDALGPGRGGCPRPPVDFFRRSPYFALSLSNGLRRAGADRHGSGYFMG